MPPPILLVPRRSRPHTARGSVLISASARIRSAFGFFHWDDEYVANVTDLPNYYLTVQAGGQSKTVRQYGVDEPADFWVIAALVDHLAEAVDWTAAAAAESAGVAGSPQVSE